MEQEWKSLESFNQVSLKECSLTGDVKVNMKIENVMVSQGLLIMLKTESQRDSAQNGRQFEGPTEE